MGFTPATPNHTIVDDLQKINPTECKKYLQDRFNDGLENRPVITQLQELVDLVEETQFLNDIHQTRLNGVTDDMLADAGLGKAEGTD